ncbi:maltoporin (phage lambda and maltose receptor) [Burkholderiales bacterium JOSHI_001]|nr:maltoporin (phage lambda and maltose receptor) [Burkholderiales bacterium JOSHI_001]
MKLRQTLLATAVLGLLSTGASAIDFGGYFRAGPGQKTTTGDSARCYNGSTTNGHGGLGRLGNECHTYGEFALGHSGEIGGVKFKALWMPSLFRDGSDPEGQTVKAAEQLYVEGKGFDIAPNQSFWIGKRYYHRADVHFDDAFFVNMTGMGAGVDGIPVGGGSLGLAVFRQDDNGANPLSRFNADLENLAVNPGGKLRITLSLTEGSGSNGKSGSGISLQHNQAKLLAGGDNTLWVQYAQGSAGINMGSGTATASSSVKTTLVADSLAWTDGPLSGQTLVQFGEANDGTIKRKFNSIGGRVAYAMTNNFKLQAELGMNNSKPNGGASERVTKLTIAPTLTVGKNYYDRPELRLYASYFSFNEAYKRANVLTKSNKTAIGAQVEVWF